MSAASARRERDVPDPSLVLPNNASRKRRAPHRADESPNERISIDDSDSNDEESSRRIKPVRKRAKNAVIPDAETDAETDAGKEMDGEAFGSSQASSILPSPYEEDAEGMLKNVHVTAVEDVDVNAPLNDTKPTADLEYFYSNKHQRKTLVRGGGEAMKIHYDCVARRLKKADKVSFVKDVSTRRRHLASKHPREYEKFCREKNFLSMLEADVAD
ncbi:hypothetical protein MIND_01283500 [Mycena indigotica]|uniref:Uncharacterized protein n=1 Tax=Mycena indigotica TaxID=2126181 RepID=A0A8H6VRR1_9AGAR|nr:uncharacterized protein MIND_01283500 [Mycena indigotica]KAF7291389.1 hypothetical protein MIND_01283500 [Mycena indigotica]